MKLYLYIFTFLGFFLSPFLSSAQEQAGLRLERYAGINSIALNPSFSANFPLRWDLRLGGIDFHAQNNYGFARDASAISFLQNADNVRLVTDTSEITSSVPPTIIDFYTKIKPTSAAVNLRVDGPAFSFKVNSKMTVGLFSAYRAHGSAYRIAQSLSHEAYENSGFNNDLPISPFTGSALVWSEIGLNLAFKTDGGNDEPVHTIGISPKILIGHQGAYANTRNRFLLRRLSSDSLSFSNGSWEYGVTSDFLKNRFSASDLTNWNGRGVGFDFGYSVSIPDPYSNDPEDYKTRIGISILDVGSISFDNKAKNHVLNFSTLTVVNTDQFNSLDQVPDILNLVSETFLQDSVASLRGNTLEVGLPLGVSLQADVKIREKLYVGGFWTQRLPLMKNATRRVNTLAVVPRYDSRWFSVSVPFVLHDYERAHIGFAARIGYLTLGSDHLTSFMQRDALYGTNFYMSLKFNPFTVHFKEGALGRGGRKWKNVGCYNMSKKSKRKKR